MSDEPTIKDALNGAVNAIKRGDLETGKAGLKWVLEREPNNVLAWLWMSRCAPTNEAKLECFNRALAIDPTNKYALEGIQSYGGGNKNQASSASHLASSATPSARISAKQPRSVEMSEKPKRRRWLWIIGGGLFLMCMCSFVAIALAPDSDETTPVASVSDDSQAEQPPADSAAAESTAAPRPTETLAPVLVPTYQIAEVENISVSRAVRFRVRVTTEFPILAERINGLCEQIVEDLKSQEPLNAVVVFLFDTRSWSSGGYSIAECEYAPNGVWADAVNVQAGDYSTHKFTYEYRPKVSDPQAALSDRPTEQEHNLCEQWDKLEIALELLSESDDAAATETIAYEQTAEKNGVSVQTVKDAIFKCIVWTYR